MTGGGMKGLRPVSVRRQRVELFASAAIAAIVLGVSAASAQSYKATHVMVSNNNGSINDGVTTTDVIVNTTNTVIQWTAPGGAGTYDFQDAGSVTTFNVNGSYDYTVLNVVSIDPSRAIRFNGTTNSFIGSAPGGHIWFYSPGGIILSSTARFNVGSLLLTTNTPSDQTANFTDSSISLTGAPNPAAAITIQAGAQITANNYIAMVAPHIDQGGIVRGGGEIAYVAGEEANLTFPTGSNLFTIDIPTGSDAVNAQGQVLVHTGTTSGPGATVNTPDRNIYFVAMPKNTAVTTLLSGSIGYDAASGAAVNNEGIVLLGGGAIINGSPYRDIFFSPLPGRVDDTAANLSITNATFQQNVNAHAANITTDTTGGDVIFAKAADLSATVSNTLSVGSGQQIVSADDLHLFAQGLDDDNNVIGGSITATIAGTLRAGPFVTSPAGLLFNAQSSGAEEVGSTVTGGTVAVSVVGGTIQTGQGGIGLLADAFGGSSGGSGAGGGAIGGSATLALAGSINSGGGLTISARASGGSIAEGQSLDGVGGLARLTAAPGNGVTTPTIDTGGLTIQADGLGGTTYCDTCSDGALGGNGFGGQALLSLTDTNLTTNGISLSATGEGGSSWQGQFPNDPGKGGDGTGGLASASFTRGTITTSAIAISVDGLGGAGGDALDDGSNSGDGGAGGIGTGGRTADGNGALLNFSGSTFLAGEGIPDIFLSANATGGQGGGSTLGNGGNGGAAIGGDVSYTQDQVVAQVQGTARLQAIAAGGNGGSPATLFTYSNGGDATGGSTRFFASGGSLFTGDLEQRAGTAVDSGAGGGNNTDIPGFHGSMQGGTTSTAVDSATVNLGNYLADTSSNSANEGGQQFHDSFVSGGTASISVSGGGSLTAATGLTIKTFAVEMGGDAGAGDSVAGAVQIQTLTGGTITTAATTIDATGSGGYSNAAGAGGDGRGGDVIIEANTGTINLGAATIDASAAAGTSPTGGTEGKGGSVTIDAASGGLISASGGLFIDTRGTIFGDLNAATGGNIALSAISGQLTINGLSAYASGNLQSHPGISSGGAISISATGTSVQGRPSSFGNTILEAAAGNNPGTISISNTVADGGSPMSFGTLSALATGPSSGPLITLTSAGSAINATSATFNTSGGLSFSATGGGTFAVTNDLNANTDQTLTISGGGSATPTIQAANAHYNALSFSALGTTILKANNDLTIFSNGQVTARTLTAGNRIQIDAVGNVTVDTANVTNAAALISGALDTSVSRLEINAGYLGSAPSGAANITINNAATAGGTVQFKATRDITVASAATVRSNNALTLNAGDDIVIGAGATVAGAASPINGTTGFASLLAGDGTGPVEVHSLINAGTISAAAAALTLRADAIQSTGALVGGTTLVALSAGSQTGNDGGQLLATCTGGIICLGGIASTGAVSIGTTGRTPTITRIAGNVTAASLDVRSTGGIFLGSATPSTMVIGGAANFNAGTQSLNDLGTVGIQAGSIAVTAANDIAASATSFQSTGDITLAVGRNIFAADLIAGGRIGPGHVALTGQLNVSGRIAAGTGGIDFTAPGGITLNRVTLGDGTALTLASGSAALTVTDASTFGGATASTISLTGGATTIGNANATGSFTAISSGSINYGSITAGQATLTATGDITVGSLDVGSGTATLTAGGALTGFGQFVTSGAGLSLTGGSIDLTTPGALNVAVAHATAGDLTLTPGGSLFLGDGSATGSATINGSSDAFINSLFAGNIFVSAPNGLTFSQIGGFNVNLTSPGGAISGLALTALGTTDISAAGAVLIDGIVDGITATGPVTVSGQSITLNSGTSALNVASATAAGDINLTSNDALTLAVGNTSGTTTLTAGAAGLTVGNSISTGGFTAQSGGNIAYTSIGAGQASLTATGGITGGQLVVTGSGTASLMAGGAIALNGQLRAPGGLMVSGTSVSITSPTALTFASVAATTGDLTLTSNDAITVNSGSAAGNATLSAATTAAVGGLTATGNLTVNGTTGLTFNLLSGNSVTAGSSAGNVLGQRITSATTVSLSSAGPLSVGTDVTAPGGASVTAPTIELASLGSLKILDAIATNTTLLLYAAGDLTVLHAVAPSAITLTSVNGDVSAVRATSGGGLTISAGRGIGFNSLAASAATLAASNGDIAGGALTITGKAALQASGAIRLTDPVATGTGTPPDLNLAGANDSLGNGGDLVITAGGAILVNNAVAGGRALLTGGGAVSINQLRSGGDLTILTPGNIGFSSLAGNAVSLTSTGATISGEALAASYTTNLSSVGLLQVTNLSSADLVTGRGSRITLLGTSPLSLGALTSGGAILVTSGALTVNGILQGTTIDLGSPSIAIGSTARIGTAGTTTGVTFRNTGTGRSFIGATGTGYSLAAAGLARVQADSITLVLPQVAGSSAAQPDVVIGEVTLHGSTGTASGTLANLTSAGSFAVQTPGRVQVTGKLLLTDIAAGNSATITAGQAIDVVTPTGSILLTDTAGGAQGTLTLVAPRVTVASTQAISDLSSLTTLSARDARLARNDGAVTEQGYVVGGHLVFRVADALDIQNSGGTTPADRRGVTAGAGGIDVVATGTATPEVVLNGRQAATGGGFTAGLDLLPLVKFAATSSTVIASNAATINGCTPTSCLTTPGFGMAFSFLPMVPVPQDVEDLVADGGNTEQTLPDVTRPLIETTETSPFSFAPVVDEPVVGIGTEAIGFSADTGAPGGVPQNGSISTGPEGANGGVPQNGNVSTGPATSDANGVPQNGNISTGPANGGTGGAAQNGNLSTGPASGEPGGVSQNGPTGSGGTSDGTNGIPQNGSVSTGPAGADRENTAPPQK